MSPKSTQFTRTTITQSLLLATKLSSPSTRINQQFHVSFLFQETQQTQDNKLSIYHNSTLKRNITKENQNLFMHTTILASLTYKLQQGRKHHPYSYKEK